MTKKHLLTYAAIAALSLSSLSLRADDDNASTDSGPPKILLDKSPAIIAYQLKRLSNAQLAAIDRKPEEAKYKPIYQALLTRKGLEKKYREEAVDALAKIEKSDPASVLLEGIGKVNAEDKTTPRELASLLMAQKPEALAAQKEKLESLAKDSDSPTVKQAAYAALATADGKPDAAWELASQNSGAAALLGGIPMISNAKVRESFYTKVKELVEKAPADDATAVAAIDAIGSIPGHEAEAFKLLAGIIQSQTGDKQTAAVRSIGRIPASKWPKDQLAPLAQAIVKLVQGTPADQRTSPAIVEAVQLGNDLAGQLSPDQGAPIRKTLRGLAVRVVLFHTLTEQMMFDLRYFTVEAGKPVQIILQNDDTMPHNMVITAPGALQEIAITAGALTPPDDPKAKAFVPESPKVIAWTHLVQPGESETLSFTVPSKPGNYGFLCTYPGHWVKMYGVMQVVPDLDQYDQKPIVPKDPLTHKPFESQKNEAGAEPGSQSGHDEHHH
ncbi:MAG TPA: plastocyanin/azurin family copper-binding protein [Tepidisphaeraceae bacterium]|jgi:azurin